MIRSGLVSVTFRQLTPRQVIDLVSQTHLMAIEWGGDIHVPHGDLAQAELVRALSVDAGLTLPTYGSYYRVGHPESGPFEVVLATAQALGTPTIRVWAGRTGSAEADEEYWQRIVEDSHRITTLAAAERCAVAYEYHGNTLTDTVDSTLELLTRVDAPALGTLWQPPKGSDPQDNLNDIERLAPWIQHIHVFSWELHGAETVRLPLVAHSTRWRAYLERLATLPGDRCALLEFVRGDDPQQFLSDAATLQDWLQDVQRAR